MYILTVAKDLPCGRVGFWFVFTGDVTQILQSFLPSKQLIISCGVVECVIAHKIWIPSEIFPWIRLPIQYITSLLVSKVMNESKLNAEYPNLRPYFLGYSGVDIFMEDLKNKL